MTVAEMIAKRTVALRKVLNDCAIAVDAKGGTPADDLSGLQDAILSIPSGGGALPELTTPAEVGHVVAGKEYIDAAGTKKTGTLVVCDTITEVECLGIAGTGVSLDIESTADGSGKTMMLPEPKLVAENIVAGSSIFGVLGTAKGIRTETGTVTPAEDSASLALPCTAYPKMFVVQATDAAMDSIIADNVAAMVSAAGCGKTFPTGTDGAHKDSNLAATTVHLTSGSISFGGVLCEVSASVNVGVFSIYRWKAGVEYQWTAYYWEDDA